MSCFKKCEICSKPHDQDAAAAEADAEEEEETSVCEEPNCEAPCPLDEDGDPKLCVQYGSCGMYFCEAHYHAAVGDLREAGILPDDPRYYA